MAHPSYLRYLLCMIFDTYSLLDGSELATLDLGAPNQTKPTVFPMLTWLLLSFLYKTSDPRKCDFDMLLTRGGYRMNHWWRIVGEVHLFPLT